MVDGSLQATVGAVLFSPNRSELPRVFGCFVSSEVLSAWQAAGKVHPVALTEMYAVCLARHLWRELLNGQKVLFFIDNQGVLDCCIKGYSDEDELKKLVVAPSLAFRGLVGCHLFQIVVTSLRVVFGQSCEMLLVNLWSTKFLA